MKIGMEQTFDCSGLIVASACEVLGITTRDWDPKLRHVREMWQAATHSTAMKMTNPAVGSLFVTKRIYSSGDANIVYPGHIGIITNVSELGLTLLRASTESGIVLESPIKNMTKTLGYVAFKPFL